MCKHANVQYRRKNSVRLVIAEWKIQRWDVNLAKNCLNIWSWWIHRNWIHRWVWTLHRVIDMPVMRRSFGAESHHFAHDLIRAKVLFASSIDTHSISIYNSMVNESGHRAEAILRNIAFQCISNFRFISDACQCPLQVQKFALLILTARQGLALRANEEATNFTWSACLTWTQVETSRL